MNNPNSNNDNQRNSDNILRDPEEVAQEQQAVNKPEASVPISPGQQSSDASGVGGYGQPGAKGKLAEPMSGYNQSRYNQPGNYSQSQDGPEVLQDGYRDTEGSSYEQAQGISSNNQQGDPAQSGVKPSVNKPGTVIDAPGRETGTAWGLDQERGQTTNTQDRRNPAG